MKWVGRKGIHARAGAPNYKGSLYYYIPESEYEEGYYEISDDYDAYDNQPSSEIYSKVEFNGITHWIDTANVIDAEYKYVVNNHLFKDTRIELKYEDSEIISVYGDYRGLISNMLKQGKNSLVKKIFELMNEHFIKLRDSDRAEIREFYPGKTAEEMFSGD